MSFTALLAGAEPLEGGFALTIPENWQQGRTAYGGLSAALALVAARGAGGEGLPALRSATVNFIGPLHGMVEVRARVQRRGRNATWIAAEVLRGGEIGLAATFVFVKAMTSALHLNERPMPRHALPLEQTRPRVMRGMPSFLSIHFETRDALLPVAVPRPEILQWVRLREREGIDPETEVMLCADALPPAVLQLIDPGAPVSSMTWIANQVMPVPRTRDGWWLMRASADFAESGGSSEFMEIWNTDGEPVMTGLQSAAIFG